MGMLYGTGHSFDYSSSCLLSWCGFNYALNRDSIQTWNWNLFYTPFLFCKEMEREDQF